MNLSSPNNSCYHCGSFILPGDSFELELGGVNRKFCCAGCMAIAQTIHGEGLEVFYARRAQSSDKPAAYLASNEIPDSLAPYDDPSLLGRYTRPSGEEGNLETTLRLEKIRCAACVWLCEQHLRRIPGVKDVQINYVTQKVIVRFSPNQTSLARLLFEIERVGYEAWPFEPSLSLDRAKKERRQLLTRLGVALLGMMQVMMYAWPSYVGANDITAEYDLLLGWTSWASTVPVMVYSAGPIFQAAWRSAQSFKQTHMLGMDVPIALALALAFIAGTINLVTGSGQSYFDSITMFVAFILAARYVELLARQDAQGGAEALAKQLPATCERLLNYPNTQAVELVPVVNCSPGEVLRVSPGEVIPADGILIENASALDESLLTGESIAVNKNTASAHLPIKTLAGQNQHQNDEVAQQNRVYSGSFVVKGQGIVYITHTGPRTEMGKIGDSLNQIHHQNFLLLVQFDQNEHFQMLLLNHKQHVKHVHHQLHSH